MKVGDIMYDTATMIKFRKDLNSIKLAYKIGVFSHKYAINKIALLYANTFGIFSGIYREMAISNFEECLED